MTSVVMQSDEEFYLFNRTAFSVFCWSSLRGVFVSHLNTLNTPTNNRFLKPAEYALSGS